MYPRNTVGVGVWETKFLAKFHTVHMKKRGRVSAEGGSDTKSGGGEKFAPAKSCPKETIESPGNTTKTVSREVGESHKMGIGVLR